MGWFKRRAMRKAQAEQRRGFEWALAEYTLNLITLDELMWYTQSAASFGTYSAFDIGVDDACLHIRNLRAKGVDIRRDR